MTDDINHSAILPAAELPISGMKTRVSTKGGMLTIEFEKSVTWLQFNKEDAKRFIMGMVAQVKAMDE